MLMKHNLEIIHYRLKSFEKTIFLDTNIFLYLSFGIKVLVKKDVKY